MARRQRQAPSFVEPRRLFAASRLDVGRLKERFERSDTAHSRLKHWAVHSSDQSAQLEGLPGVTALEICKAKQVRPASASLLAAEHRTQTGNYEKQAVAFQMPTSDSHFGKTPIDINSAVDPVTVLEQASGAETISTECIDSQCFINCTNAMAEAAEGPGLARSGSVPSQKAIRKASVTSADVEHVLKPPWEMAAAPQGTACVPATDYVYMCVQFFVAVFQLLRYLIS